MGSVWWNGLSFVSGKLLVLVSTIILARILSPKDFGLVALALVFITYADVLTDLGAAEALIYLSPSRRHNDVALTISVFWSATLTIIAIAIAPAVARFFHAPNVTPLFQVLSLSLLFGGTAEVPDALLRKDLLFRRRIVADLCRTLGQGIISIVLAVAGAGPWAIVIGYVAGDLLWSVTAWAMIDYRPSRHFWRLDADTVRPLLRFGLPAVGSALLLVLVFNIDYLIVGRRLGPQALAYYRLAFLIPQTVIIYVYYVLSTVAFPLFSRTRGDRDRLERGYLASNRMQSAYGAAVGVGIAAVAPMLVLSLFGEKWAPAIVPLEAIALYAVFRAFGSGAGDVYKGIGRPRLSLWLAIVRLAIVAPALWIAANPAWGRVSVLGYTTYKAVYYVSLVQLIVAFLMAILMQGVACRVIGISVKRLARSFVPAILVGIGTAAGAGAVRLWWPLSDSNPIKLVIAIMAGAVGGLAALWLGDRAFIHEVVDLLQGLRRRAQR